MSIWRREKIGKDQIVFWSKWNWGGNEKKGILLSSVGVQTYKLLKSLSMPRKGVDKTFQELVRMITNYQDPKLNSVAERYKFNVWDRKLQELIAKYIADQRQLAEHCNYGTILQDMLRDRLVCRLKNERITCKCLPELEVDHRDGSRTATTSGMALFVAVVHSFYQWTIVTKISVLDIETVPPEHTGLDDKAFQLFASSFLKVDSSKHHYFLMSC